MYTIANIRPFGHNVGNAAISFALKNMVHDAFGRLVSIVEYPATNKYDSNKAGLTAQVVHEINRYADGVIVGGGNIFENNEIDIDETALKHLQPPLMLFSNSRGRIYDRYGRLSERTDVITDNKLCSLINRSDISLSRDSATHAHVVKLGLGERDRIGWCPTINTRSYVEQLPSLPEQEDVGVLISVRTPNLMNLPYRLQNNVTTDIELMIDTLRELGHGRIRLLCNDSRDLDFSNSFRLSKKVDTVFTGDVYLYLSLLRAAQMVISYRLHATLPAISMGTPTVNITYDERATSLFSDLGLERHHLNYVELGDGFHEHLKIGLERASEVPKSYSEIYQLWEGVTASQVAAMQEFKQLVTRYVETGRSAQSA